MIITQNECRKDQLFNNTLRPLISYYDKNGNYNPSVPWNSCPAALRSAFTQYFETLIAQQSSEIRSSRASNYWGNVLISSSGPPVQPIVQTMDLPRTLASNQPSFAKAKRTGDIIVSDFRAGKITLSLNPGRVTKSVQSWQNYDRPVTIYQYPAHPVHRDCVDIGGWAVGYVQDFVTGVRDVTFEQKGTALDCGFSTGDYFNEVSSALLGLVEKPELVVETLADANNGVQDLAVLLLETKETLHSILHGCTTIMSMYKDARAKEVRLRNSISKRIANAKAKERALLAKELTDAVANVWLQFRLSILPTVKTIEAILSDNLDGPRDYVRYRAGAADKILLPYGGELNVIHRCFIKRLYDVENPLSRYGFNLISAGWEAVPMSFIIDRYLGIGDFIAAMTSPSFEIKQGATYSWKVSQAVISNPFPCNESTVLTEVSFYSRKVIDPNHYCGISLPDSRSLPQLLDQLAIAWYKVTRGINLRK